jgi:hypothetical protein
MTKVKVTKYQMYRDGGSSEWVDEHNRRYFVLAPLYNDSSIYSRLPWQNISEEGRKELEITGIEFEFTNEKDREFFDKHYPKKTLQ